MRVKEIMVNMPDNLDTKKEIDEYYKNAMKDIKEKNKEDKKEKKATKAPSKKRAKKVEVDDDGNEIEKVKKPLNGYQKFIQDNRAKVKEENPTLNGEEIFTLIAELWNEHKKALKNKEDEDKNDSDEDDNNDSNDSNDDDIKVVVDKSVSDDDIKVVVDQSASDDDIKEEKKEK